MDDNAEWIAKVMRDWTTLQTSAGIFAFNRETGRVYKIPHPDCPFVVYTIPKWPKQEPTDGRG